VRCERGQAGLLWFPVVLIFLYMTIYFMCAYSSGSALEQAANRVMQQKSEGIIITLRAARLPGAAVPLLEQISERLVLQTPADELKPYTKHVLEATRPSNYDVAFTARFGDRTFEVRTGDASNLSYQLSQKIVHAGHTIDVLVQFLSR